MREAVIEALPSRINFALPQVQPLALPARLPDDVGALKALLRAQHEAHAQAIALTQREALGHIDFLYEHYLLYRHRFFGVSSEQSPEQSRLFDEAEVLSAQVDPNDEELGDEAGDEPGEEVAAQGSAPTRRARGKRAPLPAELPRVEIVHDVPESERVCACGDAMVLIGEEVSEQLDIVPMRIQVLCHIRRRYGCPKGDQAPVTAALPVQPLPKSNASPELLAMLLAVKYADGLPLARFEQVLARHGATIPRQTLARWAIGSGQMLQPLHNLARDRLYEGGFVHVDETEVQVLKEPGRKAQAKSYMWVHAGGPPGKPVVIYDYDPSRGQDVPKRLLAGYEGYLMTDGYDGYNGLVKAEQIRHLACMAHARRRFIDAQRVQPKGKRGRADEAIEQIAQLYRIEAELKPLTDEQRYQERRRRSVPVLKALYRWLNKTLPLVPPKSALGRALAYLKKYWPRLLRYVRRGDLPIDNNRAERAIRPFVTGRRAWMFSDTQAGAHASAVIYSLVETAKANGLEPYAWLCKVMRELPAAQTPDDFEALMPWNVRAAMTPANNA